MKTELKHTKGEWKILWNNYTHFATINTDIKTRICAIEIDNSSQIEEKTANAKLIASAPDLLEYCIASYTLLRDNKKHFPEDKINTIALFMDSMERVIKKATNE